MAFGRFQVDVNGSAACSADLIALSDHCVLIVSQP
jgi:hypothetical protein